MFITSMILAGNVSGVLQVIDGAGRPLVRDLAAGVAGLHSLS